MNAIINSRIEDICKEAVEWRRLLHQNPQTSYEETFASQLIVEKLTKFGIKSFTGIAKTGVVGVLEGSTKSDKKIALRADIDALNITEQNDFAYISKNNGKMHACGHDGHTAMLLAAAAYLSATKNFSGTVYFIFQPAEEGGAGGDLMVKEGLFDKFPADSVWGMHNNPGIAVGDFEYRAGPCMASADEFTAIVKGSGGHAAMPHLTVDPVLVAAHIITSLQTVVARNIDPALSGVISTTKVHGGSAFNIIPDQVIIQGTIRALDEQTRSMLIANTKKICQNVAQAFQAECDVTIEPNSYPVLVNSVAETKIAAEVAKTVGKNVTEMYAPSMGGEDFAFMLQKKPGSYILTGNGAKGSKGSAGLHTSRYDFNDDALIYGAKYWIALTEHLLKS